MELKALSAACKRGYDTTARNVTRLYERYYAWKHRPPTLEETRQALNHLRVVQAFIDQHWKTRVLRPFSSTLKPMKSMPASLSMPQSLKHRGLPSTSNGASSST